MKFTIEQSSDNNEVEINIKCGQIIDEKLQKLIDQIRLYSFSIVCKKDKEIYQISLKLIREKNPDIKLGQIMYAAFGRLEDLDVDFYTVKTNMVSKSFVARARRADKGIFVWVIDKEEELKNMMTYDIDAVITSDLAMTVEILKTEYTQVDEQIVGIEKHTNLAIRE